MEGIKHMNDRQRHIEKVRKLLSMAEHSASNENEAATALRQAESLMREHDIAHAELEASKIKADGMTKGNTDEGRRSRWLWTLAWAAAKVTDTKPTRLSGSIEFAGVTEDVQVAMMMFDYMVNVTERLAKQYEGTRTDRNAFKVGMAFAINDTAEAIQAERRKAFTQASSGTDLIEVKGAMIEKTFGLRYRAAPATRVTSAQGYNDGLAAGRKVSLNSQVTANKQCALR